MMANFDIAFKQTIGIEGGYANDPDDSGGETYKGISRNNFSNWKGWAKIDSVKRLAHFPAILSTMDDLQKDVKDFYVQNFWDAMQLSDFYSQSIASELFDTGVNCGVKQASIILQRSLNVLNKNETLYKNIDVDGEIGPLTLQAANAFPYEAKLFKVMNALQGAYYVEICERREKNEKFFYGWLNRVQII
jgi:lysozyme family protein